jgi:hypothetical protein
MQDRVADRLCSEYLTFANGEPPFTACDAVALSQLAAGAETWLKDYYVPATVHFDRGSLLGDNWLRSAAYRDRPYQPGLQAVSDWWQACRAHIVGGIQPLDQSVCRMLGWDIASSVTIEALRSDFGYPDPRPVREQWLDSF